MTLEPFLFSADRALVTRLAGSDTPSDARVAAVVVDWERSGKAVRQAEAERIIGVDTQIAPDTPADLEAILAVAEVPVLCRIDGWRHHGPADLEAAAAAGVAEVILPMVRDPDEVAAALAVAAGRCRVGVMVETCDAVAAAAELATLPLSRVYVGLMDLAIERRRDIFEPLYDGTVEALAAVFASIPFGFAGLTVPGAGTPVPTRLLAAEMGRVGARFTFLRRSFLRDAADDPVAGVRAIRAMISELEARGPDRVAADRRLLVEHRLARR